MSMQLSWEGYVLMRDSLKLRVREFYQQVARNNMFRQGNPVDDLTAFVVSEIGRAGGDCKLVEGWPSCFYFATKADRDDFTKGIMCTLSDKIIKHWP